MLEETPQVAKHSLTSDLDLRPPLFTRKIKEIKKNKTKQMCFFFFLKMIAIQMCIPDEKIYWPASLECNHYTIKVALLKISIYFSIILSIFYVTVTRQKPYIIAISLLIKAIHLQCL